MLIQELTQVQQRCGFLPPAELHALADRLRVPLHRLHELASFYPLFRLTPPPAVTVRVCRDMSCDLAGAPRLAKRLVAFGAELGGVAVEGCKP